MAITNIMTFELGFVLKDGSSDEVKMMEFSVYYDKSRYDDPKEVAVDHWSKIRNVDDGIVDFEKYYPVFRTFRVLNDRVPSDLGLR